MQNDIKSVIWDMGGVLLRTEDHDPRAQLANRLGVRQEELYDAVFNSDSAIRATLGEIDAGEHWENVGKCFGLSGEALQWFSVQFWKGDRLDRELMDYIQSIRRLYRTGLLSNAWSDAREVMTKRYALLEVFDFAVFSAEIGLAKPDPRIYQHLLDKMSLQPQQAIFIDDVLENVKAAQKVGMHAIRFRSRDQVLQELSLLLLSGDNL